MRYILSLILSAVLLVTVPFASSAYSARSMVLIEQSTKSVITQTNMHSRLPMASTTKIMTALVVLETASLDTVISVPAAATGVEGSSMYLLTGEKLTVSDLLYGLMLTSGNDAATALAISLCGDIPKFVALMNEKAKSLGLENTHFANPSGLPDDEHYTTAYELAILTAIALQNETFAKIVSTKTAKVPYNNNPGGRTLVNHNKLLSLYDGAIGVKTGFTKKAGRCLVGAAIRDGVTLVCVTLNDGDDWNDHITAFDYGFSVAKQTILCQENQLEIKLKTPDGKEINAYNRDTLKTVTVGESRVDMVVKAPQFLYPPLSAGDTVGKIEYLKDGEVIASTPLYITQNIDPPPFKKELLITKIINTIKGFIKSLWQN